MIGFKRLIFNKAINKIPNKIVNIRKYVNY